MYVFEENPIPILKGSSIAFTPSGGTSFRIKEKKNKSPCKDVKSGIDLFHRF